MDLNRRAEKTGVQMGVTHEGNEGNFLEPRDEVTAGISFGGLRGEGGVREGGPDGNGGNTKGRQYNSRRGEDNPGGLSPDGA